MPRFGQEVLVKKRTWKRKEWDPLNEKAYYMTPIAAYVLDKWTPMPTEGPDWRLVERGAEKHSELRRRVREKTPREKLEEDGALKYVRRLAQLAEEEEKNLLKDEPDVVDIIVKSIQSLEVLQTKIVSGREVEENFVEWKEAIVKEMEPLMLEKKALTKLSPEEAKRLVNSDKKVQALPGKAVYTLKPGLGPEEVPAGGVRKLWRQP